MTEETVWNAETGSEIMKIDLNGLGTALASTRWVIFLMTRII